MAEDYGNTYECNRKAEKLHSRLMNRDIESIFEEGLHEFIDAFIGDNNALGRQIEEDFRFNG